MAKAVKVVLKCSNCGETFEQDAKWLHPSHCPVCGADRVTFERVTDEGQNPSEEAEPKPHKHSYRKDGTCACGQVRPGR